MLLKGQLAHARKHPGPMQSPLVLPLVDPVLKALSALHLLAQDPSVAACHHPQRHTMWLLVPIIPSLRSSRLRQPMRSHNRLCTSSNSHPSPTVSQTPITVHTLAVCPHHLHHHRLVLVARQAKGRHRVLSLHIMSAPAALRLKCALLWRTEQRLHVMDTRALTSTTPILRLAAGLPAGLLRQHRLKLPLNKRLATVMSVLQQHHPRDTVSGKKMITLAQRLPPMTRSVKRLRSLIAAVLPHLTECLRLRCRARVHRMDLTLGDSMMATTHPRQLTTHPRCLPWRLRAQCPACLRHPSQSVLSTTSLLPATWMWMRTMMMRAMTRNPMLQNLSEAAHALHRPMVSLMLPRPLSKSHKHYNVRWYSWSMV